MAAQRLAHEAQALWRAWTSRWRRSLLLRVVVTTLVVSGVVVLLLASLLLDQVGRGLVQTKTNSALLEARLGAAQMQSQLEVSTCSELPDPTGCVQTQLQSLTQALSDRGAAGGLYRVLLSGSPETNAFASPTVRPDLAPTDLDRRLQDGLLTGYVYDTPRSGPAQLVVGTVLSAPVLGQYRLFHFFPLDAEQRTLALVRRTAAAAGVLLVVLLALIALLVTRQVVSPVRLAARTAERLASGLLEVRMAVHGEDDLARLAITFNTMAEALQRQIQQLEDLSRVQQRFVSDVSHELRTPLTTVRMAADVLHESRTGFPPAAARSAELLQAELNRFEDLLTDLLEISRYDAGATDLNAEPVDLVALIGRVVDQTRSVAERKGIEIEVHAVPGDDAVATVDHVRIERALRNLLVNAVDHAEGRPVQVHLESSPDEVAIVVRDQGLGLKPGEAARVFTRFWRADPSRARTTGGTGLGLAIALEDVRLHGGRLEAHGEPGLGATFRITVPRLPGGAVGAGAVAREQV